MNLHSELITMENIKTDSFDVSQDTSVQTEVTHYLNSYFIIKQHRCVFHFINT